MSTFWERQRAKLEADGQIPSQQPPTASQAPWWAEGTTILQGRTVASPEPSQDPTEGTGGHDLSKVMHLKQEGHCPICNSGDYMKPTPSTARRCWSCGYVEGRQLNEPNIPSGMIGQAATVKVKQLSSGGHFGRTQAEINQNNAVLEQSAQGRTKLA